MDSMNDFRLPVGGMHQGIHQFNFLLDGFFFRQFENSLIRNGNLTVDVILDKRPDMMILTVQFRGTIMAECDRCLEPFDLPMEGSQSIMFKYSESPHEEEEVVYLPPGTQEIKIDQYLFEFISLGIPLRKTHDESDVACSVIVKKFLGEKDSLADEENPVWSALKSFNKK